MKKTINTISALILALILTFSFISYQNIQVKAESNNPYNTDGIPAKSSTAGIIILESQFGAISEINIAVSNPIGTPIIKAPNVPYIEAIIIGNIPYFGSSDVGYHCVPKINLVNDFPSAKNGLNPL